MKQNQTIREYLESNGFEIRVGKFYNYNPNLEPNKMEIRILHEINDDIDLFYNLLCKILEWVK